MAAILHELYPESVVKNKLPENLLDEDLPIFETAISIRVTASHYWRLQNVLLLKDTVFRNFKLWEKYSQITPFNFKSKLKRLLLCFLRRKQIKNGIWITDNLSTAYFHWVTDCLSRLISIDDVIADHIILLPKNLKDYTYITQSLELLNYKYEFLEDKAPYVVHDLLLPSHIAPTGNFQPIVIETLRKKFLNGSHNKKPNRRIFISRQKASFRKLVNEEQFIPYLKRFGFEIHLFEDYSLAKQIELMSECNFLIGLHGGGLTNILFMQPGTVVMELRKRDDNSNNCYYNMASVLGMRYYYIKCDADHSITQLSNFKISEEGIGLFVKTLSEYFSNQCEKS